MRAVKNDDGDEIIRNTVRKASPVPTPGRTPRRPRGA